MGAGDDGSLMAGLARWHGDLAGDTNPAHSGVLPHRGASHEWRRKPKKIPWGLKNALIVGAEQNPCLTSMKEGFR